MGKIFEVRVEKDGRVRGAGAWDNRSDAETGLAKFEEQVDRAGGTNDRYWIEEIDTIGLFAVPTRPTPRERFTTRVTEKSSPGTWTTVHVEVLDRDRVVGEYDRNYSMLQTFEPFRQGERHYALISPDYTATAVMDLSTGRIVAGERPSSGGFCPVGFYVPDWWDVHGERVLPGSLWWTPDHEWPTGDFGFVWGCVWGDDSSWKVQYLDLSQVADGTIRRDDRFGYVKLAANPKLATPDFIRLSAWEGHRHVTFAIEQNYDLGTGHPVEED